MNKPYKIAVIDYRISNMYSIQNALNMLGFECEVTSDYSIILAADGAILPGVGSFPEAMKHIKALGLDKTIRDFIATDKPFMGICLGFQLLFDSSDEIESTAGLSILSGKVIEFPKKIKKMRVPHVGWNTISKNNGASTEIVSPFFDSDEGEYFYFVHSCYVVPENKDIVHSTTEYGGIEFCSSIVNKNIFACQFHPEKSGEKGMKVLSEMFNKKMEN